MRDNLKTWPEKLIHSSNAVKIDQDCDTFILRTMTDNHKNAHVEYIRKDISDERIKELEAKVAKLEAEKIAGQWYPLQGDGNPDFDSRMKIAIDALTKLACLGNGSRQGNSDGNRIAQEALRALLPTGSKG